MTMVNIIFSDYYSDLSAEMLNSITKVFDKNNLEYTTHKVNGVWEIPYLISKLSDNSTSHFIALGVVIKGETDHYEYISSAVANGLINLTIKKNIYISNCILNVLNYDQASERAILKGKESAEAILNILNNE